MTFFTKMHSLGNDFVIIDATKTACVLSKTQIAQLANRHKSIGFDQLLLLEKANQRDVDFSYRVFNADGSEAEQCGNGVRCLARFVWDKGLSKKPQLKLATAWDVVSAKRVDSDVQVRFGAPIIETEKTYPLVIQDATFHLGLLSLGNPHAVLQVNDLKNQRVDLIGRMISTHAYFPLQTNVEFMEVIDQRNIQLRIFERVVGETSACGTGACAAVVMGCVWGLLGDTVLVQMPGGVLRVYYAPEDNCLELTGSAEFAFSGEFM